MEKQVLAIAENIHLKKKLWKWNDMQHENRNPINNQSRFVQSYLFSWTTTFRGVYFRVNKFCFLIATCQSSPLSLFIIIHNILIITFCICSCNLSCNKIFTSHKHTLLHVAVAIQLVSRTKIRHFQMKNQYKSHCINCFWHTTYREFSVAESQTNVAKF